METESGRKPESVLGLLSCAHGSGVGALHRLTQTRVRLWPGDSLNACVHCLCLRLCLLVCKMEMMAPVDSEHPSGE